jgi:CheY-like chemotaxis protein
MAPIVDLSSVLILIAEDDMANFYLIKELLSATSVKILHAWDGEETIKMFKNNPSIDLILMDIRMPKMDGYEATTEIRKFDQKVAIIAQTGYVFEEDKQKAKALGFNDYMCKPLNEEDLISVIVRHIDNQKIPG